MHIQLLATRGNMRYRKENYLEESLFFFSLLQQLYEGTVNQLFLVKSNCFYFLKTLRILTPSGI